MRPALVPVTVMWTLCLFGGCSSFGSSAVVTLENEAGPVDDGGVRSDAVAPSNDGAPAEECPSLHGPSMVKVAGFCIDSTEVTVGQYAEFLAAMADRPTGGLSDQPAACASNDTFRPRYWWPSTPAEADAGLRPAEVDKMPVAVVDWCDAHAFCAWAGKRLCGRIGGGPLAAAEAVTTASEWFVACSHNGSRATPYGDDFDREACNGVGSLVREPVASHPRCVGGYDGLFDMSGNVQEWIDACDPDSGVCPMMGGSFGFPEGSLYCGATDDHPRSQAFPRGGIRCCATLSP